MIELPLGDAGAWDRRLWVPALRVRDGATVVFGRDRSDVSIRDAIEASCAVPLLFEPKAIGGERFLDGAIPSGTHADILAEDGHRLVVVSAPMSRAGRSWVRQRARRQLRSELASLHRAGCRTLVLVPDDDVVRAAEGYPLRHREARSVIVETARRQTMDVIGRLPS